MENQQLNAYLSLYRQCKKRDVEAPPGIQGAHGDTGIQGAQGNPGLDGIPGRNGSRGVVSRSHIINY